MTRQEQRLADQRAAMHQRIAELKQRQHRLDVQQAALDRRKRERRLLAVGKLVEAAGLLWVDDGVLEKLLADIRERAQEVRAVHLSSGSTAGVEQGENEGKRDTSFVCDKC
jgi:ferric-dicitrate binding protein FerR (iron transport regulator)